MVRVTDEDVNAMAVDMEADPGYAHLYNYSKLANVVLDLRDLRREAQALRDAAWDAQHNLEDARKKLKFGSQEYICVVSASEILGAALSRTEGKTL